MKKISFAAKALIVHNGHFLAMRRAGGKSQRYELPGGRMEFGETAEETVAREVFEETNLHVTPICLLDTWNYFADEFQITGVIFLCITEDISGLALSDEHEAHEWLPANAESAEKMQALFRPQMEKWDWSAIAARN